MVSDAIASILILQDRDARHRSIERQLAQIPVEIESFRRRIAEARKGFEEARDAFRSLEVRRAEIEGNVEDIEERIRRYKTQQMQVKKNEEYQALELEIARAQAEISTLEDEELDLLERIDLEKIRLEHQEEDCRAQTRELEGHIATLERNAESLRADLEDAVAALAKARDGVEQSALAFYDFVSTQVRRAPFVVPIVEGKCGGCHLRVSGDIASQARRGESRVRCDSCGRIVYAER